MPKNRDNKLYIGALVVLAFFLFGVLWVPSHATSTETSSETILKRIEALERRVAELEKRLDMLSPGSTPTIETSTPDIIETRIDGTFEGWSGETIFKLENGQLATSLLCIYLSLCIPPESTNL